MKSLRKSQSRRSLSRSRAPVWFAATSLLLSCLIAVPGCSDRQRQNPLDPQAISPANSPTPLDAVAGDGQVLLRWDYSRFRDISGFRLYRRGGGGDLVRELPPESLEFADEEVENGATYVYELALVVEAEEELLPGAARVATPGPEVAWVADRGSGLVWQLAPDGRHGLFAQGRFSSLVALATDLADRSCWVSAGRTQGLYRIAADGDLRLIELDLSSPGDLSIDSDSGTGWVADLSRQRVFKFSTRADIDSLGLTEVDASFQDPISLAAVGASCWIVDRAGGRVLLYDGEAATRAGEWRGFDRPGSVAAQPSPAGDSPQEAWVLYECEISPLRCGGLMKLDRDGEPLVVELPFSDAVALSVDRRSGDCWVLGEMELAAFDRNGSLMSQFDGVPGGRDLAVDGANRQVWVAGSTMTWKFDMDEQIAVPLTGFTALHKIQIDPGGGG